MGRTLLSGEMRRRNLQWVLFLCGELGVSLRGLHGRRMVGFAAAWPSALYLVPEQLQAHLTPLIVAQRTLQVMSPSHGAPPVFLPDMNYFSLLAHVSDTFEY